jgi:mannosyltransferase
MGGTSSTRSKSGKGPETGPAKAGLPQVVVTNFDRNFSGVSATIANLLPIQAEELEVGLLGRDLGLDRIRRLQWSDVFQKGWRRPRGKPFSIWHVRRNLEMEWAVIARDVLRMPIRTVFTSASKRRHSRRPRWLISRMDAVVATTEEAASYLSNVWSVVPHGIDTRAFVPPADKKAAWRALGWPGEMGVGIFGRIRRSKGTDLFVEAMCRVLPDFPGVTALINGIVTPQHMPFVRGLRERIAAAGLEDRFVWSHADNYAELIKRYQGVSLMVACPRREEFGLTPIEAMACGAPTLLSDTGDFRNMTVEGETGFIVPVGDVDALEARLRDLLANPGRLAAMGIAARRKAEQEHDVHREVAGIREVYDRLWAEG